MSKYICETCNKPKPIDTSALQVGDEVNFTVQSVGKKSASFRSKTGVITDIKDGLCFIDVKGVEHVSRLDSVTPSDAPSPLTWIFGECKCQPTEVAAQ